MSRTIITLRDLESRMESSHAHQLREMLADLPAADLAAALPPVAQIWLRARLREIEREDAE